MDFKIPNSPPIPPCHGQVCWDATSQSSEAFFHSNFYCFGVIFRPSPPAAASSVPSRGNRDKILLELLPSRGNPDHVPGPGRQGARLKQKE